MIFIPHPSTCSPKPTSQFLVPSLPFYNPPSPISAAHTHTQGWRTSHWIVGKLAGTTPQILSLLFSQILKYDIKFTVFTWEFTILQSVGKRLLHSCSWGICLKDTVFFQAEPDGILLAWLHLLRQQLDN